MTVAQDFHFKLVANAQLIALIKQIHQPVAGKLHRHTPAHHALFEQYFQRHRVVAVQRVPGDERQFAFSAHIHHAEIAGFNQKLTVLNIAFQFAQFGGCLHQRQRGEHNLLATSGERFCHLQPVANFGCPAFATDRFTEINHVCAAGGGLLIKIFKRLFWPVPQHRP